jgi:hypothetical protein
MRRDWTPQLRGKIYCSPACGGTKGFCTRAAYDRAVKDSADLAQRLGDDWEPVVWENLGWHWRVGKGCAPKDSHADHLLEITHHDGTFTAWFQGSRQFICDGPTPEDALGFLMQDVRTFVRRIEHQLNDAA